MQEPQTAMDRVIGTAKAFLLPAAIGALMVYFCYHALAGEQGLAAWADLQIEEADLESQITSLKSQRETLEQGLSRLRDRSLDLDFVEEIARARLSYVRPDELLVSSR